MVERQPGISVSLGEGGRSPPSGADGKVSETDGFSILADTIFYTCILDPNERWLPHCRLSRRASLFIDKEQLLC